MNIIVCVKQVVDPEAPPSTFKMDPATNRVVPPSGTAPVVDPYGEFAVEAALKLKDAKGGKVTVLSMGNGFLREVIKKPLSMGADELVLLEDPAFVDADSWSTANALVAAIKKIGTFDVVLCGREASDWNGGQVGIGIAEMLGLPSVTLVKKIEVGDGKLKVQRVIPDGYESVEVGLPAVLTISNEIGQPRYPSIKGIMAAKKKEPVVWKPADIGLDATKVGAAGRHTKVVKLFQPVHEGKVTLVTADTPELAGAALAVKLREAKLI